MTHVVNKETKAQASERTDVTTVEEAIRWPACSSGLSQTDLLLNHNSAMKIPSCASVYPFHVEQGNEEYGLKGGCDSLEEAASEVPGGHGGVRLPGRAFV